MEKMIGRRDGLLTVGAVLVRIVQDEGGCEEWVCKLELAQFHESGRLKTNSFPKEGKYDFEHDKENNRYNLKDSKGQIVMCARRQRGPIRSCLILDQLDPENLEKVVRRSRMSTKHAGGLSWFVHELNPRTTDEAAVQGKGLTGKLEMSFTSKMCKLECDIAVHPDETDEVWVSFCYFLHLVLFRHRSVQYGFMTGKCARMTILFVVARRFKF